MDLAPHIQRFGRRLEEVEAALSAPDAFANPAKAQEMSREYARLKDLVASGRAWLETRAELAANREMLADAMAGRRPY